MSIKVIIPASGSGIRFGGRTPKQFLKIDGKEILAHTISRFHKINSIDEIIISAREEYFDKIKLIIRKNNFYKIKKIVEGGKLRQDSVYRGLINLECKNEDIVLVHDAVRPFISAKKILELIKEAKKYNNVILAMRISETVKKVDKDNFVEKTIDREGLWSVQTPQAFRYDILKKSFEKAVKKNFIGTDESSIVEFSGYKVKVIEGEKENVKITVMSDIRKG